MRAKAYVPLAGGLSVDRWGERYRAGEVPDVVPYGLNHLASHSVALTARSPRGPRPIERITRAVRYRIGELEVVETVTDARERTATTHDVVLCIDERAGVPSALLASTSRRFAPVVTGVAWLTTPENMPRGRAAVVRRALRSAAAVWTQSPPMVDVLVERWGVDPTRVHFVPMGIDTDFYSVQPAPPIPGVVASAGEDPLRDHQLLVDAVAGVRAVHPGTTLELATSIPVDAPDGMVTLHTERLDGRMRDVYRRSTVVALAIRPTVTGSGLTVVLEAMASGRPVVVTDNPGIDAYVEHGVTGIRVPPGNRDAFVAALADLLGDPERARRMGEAAASRVRERFTSAAMSESLARILHRVRVP